MSERDIHSKILREQNTDAADSRQGPPPILPRMQSSKSVPSLNSKFSFLNVSDYFSHLISKVVSCLYIYIYYRNVL